jgi:hypothetical protein
MLRLLKNETFSLGFFTSHTIVLNSFADVESVFKAYAGTSLFNATKQVYSMDSAEVVYALLGSSIQRLFEKRHII